MKKAKTKWILHLMMLPAFIILIIFSYIPMFGLVIAFLDYKPALG